MSTIQRSVAAWLLTVPGPIRAADRASALNEARRKFDPRVSLAQFERSLADCGYEIVEQRRGVFTVAPALRTAA